MAIIAKYVVLIALLLAISDITEGRKSLSSGRNRGSSSSGSSSRRQQQTSSSGHVTKPTYQNSQSASNSHADAAKLSYGSSYNSAPNPRPAGPSQVGSSNTNYQQPNAPQIPKQTAPQQQSGAPIGWNVPKQESPSVAVNKPPSYSQANQGPPPAYSPHNVPGGAHSNVNDRPPMYSPPGSNSAYPVHQGPPPGYPGHQAPPPSSGIHQAPPPGYPIHQGPPPSYQQSAGGGIGQPSVVHHHYNSNNAAVQPPPGGYMPVSGVQPGFYPAGSFPQQSSSSGLGFGTGLIAGGLGGALLGHALTPSRSGGGSSSNNDNDHDRVIIINNTPGAATVGAPGAVAPGAVAPGGPIAPGSTYAAAEAPVPLAPFPSQPNAAGAPMQPQMSADPAAMPPMQNSGTPPGNPINPAVAPAAVAAGSVGTDNVPLAPMPPNNGSEPPPPADQVQYGIMCVPIYVNVSDPVNPENITLVEQMYCYNATIPTAESTTSSVVTPAQPNMMAEQPNMQSPMTLQNQQQPQQSELQNTPPATQKPSSASLADTTIVKSGSFGIHETISIFGLLISTTIASFLIN